MADLTSLLTAHVVVLRNASGVAIPDTTSLITKDIPTVRSGVVVPDNDLNTELTLYIVANG